MQTPLVKDEERPQEPAATLGDVLYAKTKALVPEREWAALVQSIAAGDHSRCMLSAKGRIARARMRALEAGRQSWI